MTIVSWRLSELANNSYFVLLICHTTQSDTILQDSYLLIFFLDLPRIDFI